MDFLPETVRAVEANYFSEEHFLLVSLFFTVLELIYLFCFQLDSARVVHRHTSVCIFVICNQT